MRIQDIIRSMIDMVDGAKPPEEHKKITVVVAHPTATIEKPEDASPLTHVPDDLNRWRQIIDLADKDSGPIGNAPDEKYADIDAVTSHAGGGLNGPKHPHDLRVKDPSIYPHHQEC